MPVAIRDQLRRRGVDVLTAQEDDSALLSDEELLQRATHLGRLLFTQDIRFKALADRYQAEGQAFAGLVFGHQLRGSVGQYVRDLELIALATDPSDWVNRTETLPLR